jgi:hypothetical protein
MIRPQSPDPPASLEEIVQRIGRLTPNWRDPGKFYDLRDGIVDDLHQIARNGPPQASSRPAGLSPREQRLEALARGLAKEVERLRRRLGEAARVRPRRRWQGPDSRQMTLPF